MICNIVRLETVDIAPVALHLRTGDDIVLNVINPPGPRGPQGLQGPAGTGGIPTGVSTLAGYGITDAYTKTETDSRISAVVGAAPTAFDTLAKIAAALQSGSTATAALSAAVATKLDGASNLSDLADAPTARQNLGLGTAATKPATAFDQAGAATTVQTTLDAHAARIDNPHAVTKAQIGLGNVPNADATNRANHTGTQPANTITGLATVAASGAYADLTGKPTPLVNVRDYGAKGDGATDDRTAINAAIAAAVALATISAVPYQPSVYFPSGVYMVGAAGLTLSNKVRLSGESQSGTTLKLSATSTQSVTSAEGTTAGTVFLRLASGDVEIERMTLDANGKTTFATFVTDHLLSGVTLSSVTVKGSVYGAFFQSTSTLAVRNCRFTGASSHQAFYQAVGTASDIKFIGNTFDPAGGNAAATTVSTCLWLQARVASTGTYAGGAGNVTNFVFSGNTMSYAGLGAVEADGFVATADGTSTVRGLAVTGNTISMTGASTSGWGIEFGGAIDYACSGNTITLSGASGIWASIDWGSQPTKARGSITGNTVRSTAGTGYGIVVSGGAMSIASNMIVGWLYGMSVRVDGCTIAGNTIDGVGVANSTGIQYTKVGGNGCSISANTLNGVSYAISCSQATIANLNVTGNVFVAGAYGIVFWSVTAGSGNVLSANTFTGYSAANRYYGLANFAVVTDPTPTAFAGLPAGANGSQCVITDCNTTTIGGAAAAGGANRAVVWYSGGWKVMAA